MREHIDTIPVTEAYELHDECPFCAMERKAEQSAMRYLAGPSASYMEPDMRSSTDAVGFCTEHIKKLYQYGNTLGAALILQTHFAGLLEEFEQACENVQPPERKLLFFRKKTAPVQEPYWQQLRRRTQSCWLCNRVNYNMNRYYHTFFVMTREGEFRRKVEASKGFCLRHFSVLLEKAEEELSEEGMAWFYPMVYRLERENLRRVKGDLDWLVAKYDYRNAGADWRNSRDALQRTMQKLQGGYPADGPYRQE